MKATLFGFVLLISLLPICYGALYGYYSDTTTMKSSLVAIDTQTGDYTLACDLSALPPLSGASSSSDTNSNFLFFYFINTIGNISLVQLDPTTCKYTSNLITGLANGQNLVTDMKFDSATNKLYMVFPNPFCMHGSLDSIDVSSTAVEAHLTNVIDPVGLNEVSGIALKSNAYYFVGVPMSDPSTVIYALNRVDLATGNSTLVDLVNNNLDLGDLWDANFTMNVYDTANGTSIFGAISPPTNTNAMCYPSGFYTVDPTTGNVLCVNGPIDLNVFPIAEFDQIDLYFYQIFSDNSNNYYLSTYDVQKQRVLAQVPCSVCGMLSILSYLPGTN